MATADVGIKLSLEGQNQVQAGLQQLGAAMQQVGVSADSIKGAIGGVSGALTALVGVATVGGFAALVKGSIDSAAALNDLAIQSGASVEALSGLASVGKLSGQSAESIASAMNKLARNMAGATEESKGTGKALEAIGINFANFKNLAPEAQMQAIAKAMDGFADGSGKAAVAMALYGKEGAQMLPFLKDLASVGDLSAKVTTEQAAAADNLGDTLTKLKGSSSAWVKEVAMGMVPALDDAATAFFDVMNGANGLRDGARKLSADGSIEQWTRNAIEGLTYLMDVFSGLKAVVKSVGKFIGAELASAFFAIEGIGAAFSRVMSGDFKGAAAELSATGSRVKEVWSSLGEDLKETWSEQTLGAQIRGRMADIAAVGKTAEAAKAKLDFVNVTDDKPKAEKTDPQEKAYADLVASIKEKISTQQQELEVGGKLTEAEQTRLQVQKLLEKGAISQADATSAATQALLDKLDATEQARRAEEAYRQKVDDLAKTRTAELSAQVQATGALKEQVAQQLQANAAIGLTQTAVTALEAARLEALATSKEELANIAELKEGNITLADQYREQADALRNLAKAKKDGAARQTAFDEAKKAADEWQRAAEKIENTLTDALMRGFESGKDFAKNLRDTVVNMFKTLVLRPVVQAIVSPVAGAITGSLGLAGAANAATGAAGAATGAGLLGALGTGLGSGFGMIAGGGIGGWLSASTSLIGTGTAAGAMAGLGALAGPIGAVLAVAQLVKSLDDSGTYHTGGLGSYSAAGGMAVGDAVKSQGLGFDLASRDYIASGEKAATQIAQTIVGIIDSTAETFGGKAGAYAATAFADDTSKDGAWGALMVKLGDQMLINWENGIDKWPGREFSSGEAGAKEYAAAIAKDVRDYLLTQTPDWADAMLTALGDAPSLENLGTVVTQINAAAAAMEGMGRASAAFAKLGEQAENDLIKALGGGGAASGALGSYYDKFYSDSERATLTRGRLQEAATSAGLGDLPTTIEGYRQWVDSALESGNTKLAAALIKASDLFADSLDKAVDGAKQAAGGNLGDYAYGKGGWVQKERKPITLDVAYLEDGTKVENYTYTPTNTGNAFEDMEWVPNASTNSQASALQEQRDNLLTTLAGVSGDLTTQFARLTKGMTEAEIALYKGNRTLEANIAAWEQINTLTADATNLSTELARALGDEAGARAQERTAFLAQFKDADQAERDRLALQYDQNQATRDQITAASERVGLENQLLQAQGNTVAIRKKELEAIQPVNRALQQQIWALQDLQKVAEELPAVLAKYLSPDQLIASNYRDLAQTLIEGGLSSMGVDALAAALPGTSKEVFARLAADMYNAAGTTDAMRLSIIRAAGAFADLKQTADDTRRATAYNLADVAFAGVERAIASQRKLAETSKQAAEKLKAEVQGIFDTLQSSVDNLFGSVDSTKQFQAAQGQQFIAAALAAARATGALPDGKDLSRAINAATAGLDATQFASQADADFNRLVLANELRDLQDISGDQLTEAERQLQAAEDMLTALDSTYETAKKQLDELKGINVGVSLTLPAALQALALALGTATAINKPISQTLTSSTGGTFNRTTGIGINPDGAVWDVESVRSAAFELQAAQGSQAVYQAIKDSGYTLADAEKIFGSPAGSLEAEAKKLGLPVFHDGTNYVPRTGYALLQEGEAVIPRAYNPAANGAGPGSPRLERLVEGLTAEVQRLQAIVNDGNTHQRRTADTLENVTEGGANMRTVAA